MRGEIRLKSFAAVPEDIGAYGPLEDEAGGRRFDLRVTGSTKGVVRARIKGVEGRDAAEALKGVRLYVARAALPPPDEDEFYHEDLVGLCAEDAGGALLGTVKAVHDFGAGDLLEITPVAGGRTFEVPFTRAVVPVVDVKGGRVVIEAPEGLLDGGEPEAAGDDSR